MSDEPKAKDKDHTTQAKNSESVQASKDAQVDWDNPDSWPKEVGGASGPEPTRYGDWESNGRCSDF